jgi:hypothetical protein
MTQPTPATQPALTDLLAGVIDLGADATPPHGPGPCSALCVPACAGKAAGAAPESTPELSTALR